MAAIGLLTLSAANNPAISNSKGQRNAAERQSNGDASQANIKLARAIRDAIESSKKDEGCLNRSDKRDSDLCAQWKAADAARDAADYSFWALLVGILGTTGVVATLYYTRKAVLAAEEATKDADKALEIAARNTDAVTEQVEVSREAAHRQLRAYLSVKSVQIEESELGEDLLGLNVLITNNGQTPALVNRIVIRATWAVEGGGTDILNHDAPTHFQCHKDTVASCPFSFKASFEKSRKAGHIVVIGRIDYDDAFGMPQVEELSWRTQPHEFGPFDDLYLPLQLSAFPVRTILDKIEQDDQRN